MNCYKIFYKYKIPSKNNKILCRFCVKNTGTRFYIYHHHFSQPITFKCDRCEVLIPHRNHRYCDNQDVNGHFLAKTCYQTITRFLECSDSEDDEAFSRDSESGIDDCEFNSD